MKKTKGLFGGIVLIVIGLCLVFPPIFTVLSRYFLAFIGIYLILLGLRALFFSKRNECCRFYHKDLE